MHKVLCVYDVHVDYPNGIRLGWAYMNRCLALQKYAPDDFEVDICQHSDINWEEIKKYDLIYNCDYMVTFKRRMLRSGCLKTVLTTSYNSDSNRRGERWEPAINDTDFLIINNKQMFDHRERHERTCCISNGVDAEVFYPKVPIEDREHRIIWFGSSNVKKGKNWQTITKRCIPELEKLGFICNFTPIDQVSTKAGVLPIPELVDRYNRASYVMCASVSEGTPNLISEGASCGCVPVTVPVGNVREWGTDGENCVLADYSIESFIEKFKFARENRESISHAASAVFSGEWSYTKRAPYFYQLWRRLIADGPDSVSPFSHDEVDVGEI